MVCGAVFLGVPGHSSVVLRKEAFWFLGLIYHLERCLDSSSGLEGKVNSDALLGALISLTP